jgi:hypothetical protein
MKSRRVIPLKIRVLFALVFVLVVSVFFIVMLEKDAGSPPLTMVKDKSLEPVK